MDAKFLKASAFRPAFAAAALSTTPALTIRPRLPLPAPPPAPAPPPVAPAPAPAPVQVAPPVVPAAPGESPFDKLPFPSPGDRIKADDFKALSQSLRILYDLHVLAANLLGRTFGEARLALGTQGYQIARVMTVFGEEVPNPSDGSQDPQKVVLVVPAAPGERRVFVVLTEAVDKGAVMPNVIGLTYGEAQNRIRAAIGNATLAVPPTTPDFTGRTLAELQPQQIVR